MPENSTGRKRRRNLVIILVLAFFICTLFTSCVTTSSGESVSIFTLILVRPFAFVLKWIYGWCKNFGLALILFTIFTRLILLPLNIKSKKGMLAMQKIQPQQKALEKKYGKDKQKYQEEVSKLYQKNGVSPMSGCLPTLISLPIMFALYWPISQPLKYLMNLTGAQIDMLRQRLIDIGATVSGTAVSSTTSEIAMAQAVHDHFSAVSDISSNLMSMDMNFLGMNLGATPSWHVINALFFLPIISALTALALSKITTWLQKKTIGNASVSQSQQNGLMVWMMPIVSLWIGFTLPAGLAIYWIMSNIVAIAQEFFITDHIVRKEAKASPEEAGSINDKGNRKHGKNKR